MGPGRAFRVARIPGVACPARCGGETVALRVRALALLSAVPQVPAGDLRCFSRIIYSSDPAGVPFHVAGCRCILSSFGPCEMRPCWVGGLILHVSRIYGVSALPSRMMRITSCPCKGRCPPRRHPFVEGSLWWISIVRVSLSVLLLIIRLVVISTATQKHSPLIHIRHSVDRIYIFVLRFRRQAESVNGSNGIQNSK